MSHEDCNNGRTHEPSLREVVTDLDGLRELLLTKLESLAILVNERDRLYLERDDARRRAVEVAFAAQKESINAALAAADRAVLKAELATEKRFESVNEFRATLDQQQRTLIPRTEVNVLMGGVTEKIDGLIKQVDTLQAERLGIRGGWGYAIGVVGLIVLIVTLIGFVMSHLS